MLICRWGYLEWIASKCGGKEAWSRPEEDRLPFLSGQQASKASVPRLPKEKRTSKPPTNPIISMLCLCLSVYQTHPKAHSFTSLDSASSFAAFAMSPPLTFNLCTAMLHGYISSPSSMPLVAQKSTCHGERQELPAPLAPSPPLRHCCRACLLRRAMRYVCSWFFHRSDTLLS